MTNQCIFPLELVFQILGCTSPIDVVRWRTVSKWFHALTKDPELWKVLYENAPFVRPPGPFPTLNFERAFVRSAQLDQLWMTEGIEITSHRKMSFKGCIKNNFTLLGGRWFIACQPSRFVLYDTDHKKRVPRLLWVQAGGELITHWDFCQAISDEGQLVVYVLLSMKSKDSPWTLLEFRLDADSGALCETVTLDVPLLGSEPTPELYSGQHACAGSPLIFVSNPNPILVFNTRTRTFFKFPEFRLALHEERDDALLFTQMEIWIVPINTHVIIFRHAIDFDNSRMPVQAFSFPNDQHPVKDEIGTLRLTHEGMLVCRKRPFGVVRNPVVNPTTGSIDVRLLASWCDCCAFQFMCLDMTLEPPFEKVSPITVKRTCVTTTSDVSSDSVSLASCRCRDPDRYAVTNNGYVRGIIFSGCSNGTMKFAIDATHDRCVAVVDFPRVSDSSRPRRWADHFTWDSVRGSFVYAVENTVGVMDHK